MDNAILTAIALLHKPQHLPMATNNNRRRNPEQRHAVGRWRFIAVSAGRQAAIAGRAHKPLHLNQSEATA